MEIKELIDKLLLSPALVEMTYKYNNQLELSGWLLRKPKFIKHDKKGTESCSMILYQVINANGELKLESFSCMCYVKELVEQLKQVDNVLFLVSMGKIRYHFKYGSYSQLTEMKTIMELDLPLANEWGKE